MIEFANRFDRLFQLLIIVQPPADLFNSLATNAELAGPPTRIAHRQNENPMPLAAGTFRTVLGMPHDTLEKRAAEQLTRDQDSVQNPLARAKGLFANHCIK